MTDDHQPADLADAVDDLTDELRLQNALLLQLVTEVDRGNAIAMTGHPEDARRSSRTATADEFGPREFHDYVPPEGGDHRE